MSTRCPIDGNEFPDKQALGAHITQYHPHVSGTPSFSPPPVAKGASQVYKIKEDLTHGMREEPAGKPISAVEKAEMDKQTAELQARLGKTSAPTAKPTKPTPIKLDYKYSGTCPTCNTNVSTLIFGELVFAYCKNCDKQIENKKVIPISEQLPVTPKTNDSSIRTKTPHTVSPKMRPLS